MNGLLELQLQFSLITEELARQEDIEFIWTDSIFRGHEPCGVIVPRWMDFVPLSEVGGGHTRLDPGAMHPNRNGHYILSRIVACYLYYNGTRTRIYDHEAVKECARYGRYR